MGCWGITAFESEAGLDAVGFIRENLPGDGKLEVKTIIDLLRGDSWCAPPDVTDGDSHTSPMALAEIMVKFLDQDLTGLDYDDPDAAKDRKFASMASFTADKESIGWIKNYLSDTLKFSREDAAQGRKWGGWLKEQDWISWQVHMESLIGRMDELLSALGDVVELIKPAKQEQDVCIKPDKGISGMGIT